MFYLIWAFQIYATLNIYSNHFKVFHIKKKKKCIVKDKTSQWFVTHLPSDLFKQSSFWLGDFCLENVSDGFL